ncbi:Arginine--tRNA ligase [Planctomycetes bacterium Poly30]|uniref:Arginine--tRNA ligase n=1 Tax=Saltatorellus ferox TaxID=2528018 RepID=A0A518ENY2_9BACT|nr:Arginine--tRNA ligase [Planctomycetes bacterium Poly30]
MQYEAEIAQMIQGLLASAPFDTEMAAADLESWLERPKDPKMGDLAFPCFRLSKVLRKAPPQIATQLGEGITETMLSAAGLEKVVVAGPYLNFYVARAELAGATIPAILDGPFLARRDARGEKVMVEYSQPNTHKAFHVGHLRNASLGDSIARLLDWVGNEVVPVNYIGDEGTHVAKCLWHLRTQFQGEIPTTHRGEFLGEQYSTATELLSLDTLTRAPRPGVLVAEVVSCAPHAEEPKWHVAEVRLGGETVTVVAGVGGFAAGNRVAYAAPGQRIAGKEVGVVKRKGVLSTGMLLSEAELGISDDNETIAVLPADAAVGEEVAEVYRKDGALPADVKVLDEFRRRNAEVSAVLQAIESGSGEIWEQWKETKDWSMDEFKRIYRWIDSRFDHDFFESELGEESKALVREHLGTGVFKESEGAIGADLSEYGLGFCVLIKTDGTALYATRDLALARRKFDEFGVDRSLYVVDDAQTLHFQQVFKCLELMGYEQASKCQHLGYAQVVLPDGKMSSRKGNVILFSQLEERLLSKVREEFLDKYIGDWPQEEIDEAAHRIALATMRYGMLNQVNSSKIIFDLDEWSARSGNTGPYMMYAYARTRSILRQVGEVDSGSVDWALLDHELESDLIGFLADYPRNLERAAEQLLPQIVCTYAYELSKKFSRWYKECSVMHAETEALKATRLQLVDATGRVIQHALSLLGVATIERM